MKNISLAFLLCVCALCATTVRSADPPVTVGLISKTIQDVTRKEAGKNWVKAERGAPLASGDMIKTGVKSLAIIKFKDNSLVRLRERSEMTVTGQMQGSSFLKSTDLQNGVLGFQVQKQKTGEEFRFTSPTSVASIRGTAGALTAADSTDTLVVTEGWVGFRNRTSGQSLDVLAGYTGISRRDGNIVTRPSTEGERRFALDALRDDQRKRLEIDLQGPRGKSNRLRIEYND